MKTEIEMAKKQRLIAQGHALLDRIESNLRHIIESAKKKKAA